MSNHSNPVQPHHDSHKSSHFQPTVSLGTGMARTTTSNNHRASNNDNPTAPLLNTSTAAAHNRGPDLDSFFGKLVWRVLPVPFLIAFICFVDRTNVSLAAVDFLRDIDLSQKAYGTGTGLFFVTYVLFQVPSNYFLQKLGAPLWLGIILIGWGAASAATSVVRNEWEFYVVRVLLGAFEAGTFPGILYYLTLFFPERTWTVPLAWSMTGTFAAMALSAPFAAGLLMLEGVGGWHGWQWMFLLEGLPAILLGFFTMWYLPRDLSKATFLSEAERDTLEWELDCKANGLDDGLTVRSGGPMVGWEMRNIIGVMLNFKAWWIVIASVLGGIMRFIGMYWAPLWVAGLLDGSGMDIDPEAADNEGGKGVKVALLCTIPYALAVFVTLLIGWSSKKLQERRLHACFSCLVSCVAFVAMVRVAKFHAVLAFILLSLGTSTGVNGGQSIIAAMVGTTFTVEQRAFGFAFFNAVSNLGGFIGPEFMGYFVDATHSYSIPIYVACGLLFVGGLIFVCINDDLDEKREEEV